MKINLKSHDHILTAYAESAAGPGWANYPVWVIIRDASGKLREECIQPSEQTVRMEYLYSVSQAAHLSMREAVTTRLAEMTAEQEI